MKSILFILLAFTSASAFACPDLARPETDHWLCEQVAGTDSGAARWLNVTLTMNLRYKVRSCDFVTETAGPPTVETWTRLRESTQDVDFAEFKNDKMRVLIDKKKLSAQVFEEEQLTYNCHY